MSDKLLIDGGQPLRGEVVISGAKNSVLKLMAAALLSPHALHLSNVPNLSDVAVMSQVLEALGRNVQRPETGLLIIEAGEATCWKAPYELVSKMRASFNVLGALLSRYGYARVPLPGGCSIGKRGVDQHVKGLEALGAEVTMDHGFVEVKCEQLKGANIVLDMPSVGATENILLASVFAEGTTVLSNAAQEPEIADLAHCLNAMGAEILGAGTSEITIHGVSRSSMKETHYEVMPDRIEAATYMVAIVATRGDALVHRVRPEHLTAVLSKLEGMGARLEMVAPNTMRVQGPPAGEAFKPVSLLTTFYPGFPTDMQAPLMTLLSVAEGTSMVSETIYENRFMHVGELKRMGAHIEVQGDVAVITGVPKLMGAPVKAYDLRAGAAMVIAALLAEGYTSLYNLYHLDRGYDALVEKLQGLQASIRRLPLEESESKQVAEIL